MNSFNFNFPYYSFDFILWNFFVFMCPISQFRVCEWQKEIMFCILSFAMRYTCRIKILASHID